MMLHRAFHTGILLVREQTASHAAVFFDTLWRRTFWATKIRGVNQPFAKVHDIAKKEKSIPSRSLEFIGKDSLDEVLNARDSASLD